MNQKLAITLFALAFTTVSFSAIAQEDNEGPSVVTPKWVSEKGYWVVEGNIHNRQERTIHFYNNAHQQVYNEVVMGKFNIHKRKTLMRMKKILDTVVIAWEQKRPVSENLFATTR
jgi:hypothetical protein